MKYNSKVTSSRRKCRKAHFTAGDAKRRTIMSSGLSKELREVYTFKTFPVTTGDEVVVMEGDLKGKTGKVIKVNRAIYKIFLDISYREKKNGQVARFGVHPSSVRITRFSMEHGRDALLEKKKAARLACDEKKAAREEVVA
ncbi:large subunit ribosomal protein L26e [Nematocida displodere]|uniref:Large subunit ribosomal protein L26e n=1 Tax=Nematocida displodere TaxID=1805483 RepID=A0A177EF84_9MICR|nr:large subunit ribosomal protein L26e [Nematocida displodere]